MLSLRSYACTSTLEVRNNLYLVARGYVINIAAYIKYLSYSPYNI